MIEKYGEHSLHISYDYERSSGHKKQVDLLGNDLKFPPLRIMVKPNAVNRQYCKSYV